MRKPEVIIIGGGQSGLAMSRSLSALGVDHLVLERGRIGERWHSERWNSLRLLSTNAQSALPGLPQSGTPDDFMPARSFGSYLQTYAEHINAPVITGVEVTSVQRAGCGYRVSTSAGQWQTRAVVIATGACETPYRPPIAGALLPAILQLSPAQYREPSQLPAGGVLVVGAASTGLQLAEEIQASGRPVILSVGNHTRAPRRYRGRDIFDQLEMAGVLDDLAVDAGNIKAARRAPSLQLVGRADERGLDLGVLRDKGVRLAGRLNGINGARATFCNDLAATTAASHRRMVRMLDRIDAAFDALAIYAPAADPDLRKPVHAEGDAIDIDLRRAGIGTVIWATGYVRRYPWLKVPVVDDRGEIIHDGGVTASPGLYVLGLVFQRRRRSSFINGCAVDADELAPVIKAHSRQPIQQVA